MTDKQFLAKVRKVKDPVRLLAVLVELDNSVQGIGDSYYRELYGGVIEQGRKILHDRNRKTECERRNLTDAFRLW